MKTDRIMLRIDTATKEQAKQLAENEGRTLSNFIIELIKREADRQSAPTA